MRLLTLILLALCLCPLIGTSQTAPSQIPSSRPSASAADSIAGFPNNLFSRITNKTSSLEKRLTRQSEKFLRRLSGQEHKLQRQLQKYDPAAARNLFAADSGQRYLAMAEQLRKDTVLQGRPLNGTYLPNADTLRTSLSFLAQNPSLLSSSGTLPSDVRNSLNNLQLLQAKMQDADQAQQYIAQRKAQIREYLMQMAHVPSGISSIYANYNKEQYYYKQQVNEYKAALNDPDKMMQKAVAILDNLSSFRTFVQSNSMLARLFPTPGNSGTALAMAGLQTKDQINQVVKGQLSSGPNAQAAFSGGFSDAQTLLSQLKARLAAYGAAGGDVDAPGFKPNNQASKTFLNRLEYGINVQTTPAASPLPPTTAFGVSIGYRINDKNTIGIGASYRLGVNAAINQINHIQFSNQGAGLRSFIDINIKKSYYVSGGFEYNYQQLTTTQSDFDKLSTWQRSGLVGVSKIVSLNTKAFKKMKVQLLWDFLSYNQSPRTSPLVFRVGYTF